MAAELGSWLERPQQRLALFHGQRDEDAWLSVLAWSRALSAQGRAEVIFLPVRRRFGTALERDILGLLLPRLVPLDPGEWVPHDIGGLREAVADALAEGREGNAPLVLVLDGLDECIDDEAALFAAMKQPGAGIRVLVTARVQSDREAAAWIDRLGWESHETISIAPPEEESSPITGLIPADSRSVAHVLACALGPLSEANLVAMLGVPFVDSDPLTGLAGLVAHDEAGVVLRDRRAAADIMAAMSPAERATAEGRLLDYGREVITHLEQGRARPEDVSSYVIEYHGALLERVGAGLSEIMALISPTWQRAWDSRPHGFLGFLTDVDKARACAERAVSSDMPEEDRARGLIAQVRCALVKASVLTVAERGLRERHEEVGPSSIGHVPMRSERRIGDGSDVAHALLALTTELSLAGRALALGWARSAAREARNGMMLCAIAEASDPSVAGDIAREARDTLRSSGAPRQGALVRAARFLPEDEAAGVLLEAVEAVCSLEAGRTRNDALYELAAGARQLPEALAEVMWPWAERLEAADRHFLLAALAPRVSPSRRDAAVERAAHELAMANQEGRENDGMRDLPLLAPCLVDPMLTKCISVAVSMVSHGGGFALPCLIERVAELGRVEEAMALARGCESDDDQFEALVRILPHLALPEREALATELVSKLRSIHADTASSWLWKHAGRLSHAIRASDLLAISRTLQGPQRMHALVALADHVPIEARREAMAEAVAIARTLDYENVDIIADLFVHARDLEVGDALYLFNRLLAALNDIGLGSYRGTELLGPHRGPALGDLAPLLRRLGGEAAVLGAAREIEAVTTWFP